MPAPLSESWIVLSLLGIQDSERRADAGEDARAAFGASGETPLNTRRLEMVTPAAMFADMDDALVARAGQAS